MAWIIALIIATLFLVLLGWMWNNLGDIEKTTKCICIVGGLILTYILTFIIYSISKIGISYESKEVMKLIQNILIPLFTIINGYVILPYIFKKLNQINNDEIEKEKLKKSIIILIIIVVIVGIAEVLYLKNIQQGILVMLKNK